MRALAGIGWHWLALAGSGSQWLALADMGLLEIDSHIIENLPTVFQRFLLLDFKVNVISDYILHIFI